MDQGEGSDVSTYNAYVDAMAVVAEAWARVAATTPADRLAPGAPVPPITDEQQRDGLAYQEAHADYEHKRDAYYRQRESPGG